jgi:hypothetical protein
MAAFDKTRFDLDVLYSDLNQFTESPNLEAISFSRSNAAGVGSTIVRDYALNDRNTFTYGVFDKVDVRSENGTQRDHTKFTQVSLAGKHEFSDRLRVKGRIGVANSAYSMPEQISFQLDRNDVNGYTYDARANDRTPIINYGFDVANPALFTLTEMRSRESTALNIVRTATGEVEYDVDEHLTLRGGINAQQYVVKYRDKSRNQTLTGANQVVGVGAFAKVVRFGRDFPFPGGDRSYVVADIDKAVAYTKLLSYPLIVQSGDTRDVAEDDLSGFGQAIVNATVLGGMPLKADFGARVARTKLVSQGFVNTTYITAKNDYTDVLPSMNLSLEPTDGVMLRLGVAKVMARPDPGQPDAGRLGQRHHPHGQFRQSRPGAVPRHQLRPGGRMVLRAGVADLGGAVLQEDRQLHRQQDHPGRLQLAEPAHQPDHQRRRRGQRHLRRDQSLQRHRRHAEGRRAAVSAALHLPARRAEGLRLHRQLHLCRLERELRHRGRAELQQADRPVEDHGQRHALLRARQAQRPGLGRQALGLPDRLSGLERQQRGRHPRQHLLRFLDQL